MFHEWNQTQDDKNLSHIEGQRQLLAMMYKIFVMSYNNMFPNKTLKTRQPESSINTIGEGRCHCRLFIPKTVVYCIVFKDTKTTQDEHN